MEVLGTDIVKVLYACRDNLLSFVSFSPKYNCFIHLDGYCMNLCFTGFSFAFDFPLI